MSRSSSHTLWFVILAAAIGLLHWPAVETFFQEPRVYDYEFNPNPAVDDMFSQAGWTIESDEAFPNQQEATVELPPGPWLIADVRLGGSGTQQWSVRIQGVNARTTVFLGTGETSTIDLVPINDATTSLTLSIAPRGEIVGGEYLNKLRLRLRTQPPPTPLLLPGIAALAALPALIFLVFSYRRNRDERKVITSASAFGLAVALGALWYSQIGQAAFGVVLAGLAFLGAIQWKRSADPEVRFRAELMFLGALLLVALQLRWAEFTDQRLLPLRPDAIGYLQIATEGSLYQTAQSHAPWVREPLFPAVLRLWMLFAPDNPASARFFGVLLGLLTPFMTWLAGRRVFSPAVGLLSAAVIASNEYWAETSVSVLRLDLVASSLLALVCVPLYLRDRPWWRAGGFAVMGSAQSLLRLNNLLLMPVFIALEAWKSKWKWQEIALALAIPVLLALPHMWFNYHYNDSGDPFLSSNIHVRYYVNKDMIGQPGFHQSLQEWIGDEYRGDVLSSAEMFSYYSAGEIARRFVLGYINIFAYRFPHGVLFGGLELLMLPGLLGAWVFLRRREIWWVGLWYVLYAFPVSFIAAKDIDYRLAAPMAPFILWIWAAGIEEAGRLIFLAVERKFKRRTPATLSD